MTGSGVPRAWRYCTQTVQRASNKPKTARNRQITHSGSASGNRQRLLPPPALQTRNAGMPRTKTRLSHAIAASLALGEYSFSPCRTKCRQIFMLRPNVKHHRPRGKCGVELNTYCVFHSLNHRTLAPKGVLSLSHCKLATCGSHIGLAQNAGSRRCAGIHADALDGLCLTCVGVKLRSSVGR